MNVNPGELDKRIRIIDFIEEKDADGFVSKRTENVIRETWAKVTRVSASEVMKAGREINLTRCRFLVRCSPKKITHSMFIVYAGEYYQIEYSNNYNESNEYIEIMATSGGA